MVEPLGGGDAYFVPHLLRFFGNNYSVNQCIYLDFRVPLGAVTEGTAYIGSELIYRQSR